MELEWKKFTGFTALQILVEIQNMTTETQCEPEQLSMTEDLHVNVQRHCVGRNRKRRIVYCEYQNFGRLCERIRARSLVVSCAWIRKEMVRTHTYKPNGKWDRLVEDMTMLNFSEGGHPVFGGSSALERGDLKSKGKGHLSLNFCVATTKSRNWFFARSFPSVSSVSSKR